MSKVVRKRKKPKAIINKEELELLSKDVRIEKFHQWEQQELIERILHLKAVNDQLRARITKQCTESAGKQSKWKSKRPFDFARYHKRKILLKLYYLGWEHHGFVTQEDTENTIERYLFDALIKSCCIESRETSNYHRCGRTDKGVSAFSQVISLEVRSTLTPETEDRLNDELRYCKILNRLLPSSIRCIAWCPIPDDFSARFDCKSRTYRYFFPQGALNIDAMDRAVKYTIGDHDFRNVCKMDVANGVVSFKRTITDARVSVSRRSNTNKIGYDMCELMIKSRAFLWHQIRCLMGILFLVGHGKETPEVMQELLDIERCPRKPQYDLAHEVPLNLWHCEYEDRQWYFDEEELLYTLKSLQKEWSISAIKTFMMENMLWDLEEATKQESPNFQTECLVLGVQSKVYRPLMERLTCDSLERKIELFEKKRKLEVVGITNMENKKETG